MCQWINDTIQEAYDNGTWEEAFEATLGKSGVDTPEPPAMDPCARPDPSSPTRRLGAAPAPRRTPHAAAPT